MSTNQFRILGLTVSSAVLILAAGSSVGRSRPALAEDKKESKLEQLLQEKVILLKEDVVHLEKLHDMGQAGFEELYAAHLALHRAQLELCRSTQEKSAILERLLGEARRREDAVKALNDVSSVIAKHRAIVDRIDVEIQLEQLSQAH